MTRSKRRPLFSDKVRQFDCTTFGALKVGERFRFGSEVDYPGMKTGLCEKLSARKYRYVQDAGQEGKVDVNGPVRLETPLGTLLAGKATPKESVNQVGSIKAVVIRVDGEGNMVRVGHYTPYLGD